MNGNDDEIYGIVKKWQRLTYLGWNMKNKSDTFSSITRISSGMSRRQMDILIVLKSFKLNTISEIAELLKISRSTLSIIMNKLVTKGYVNKEYPQGADDGRRVYFKISRAGNKILKEMGKYYIAKLTEFYNGFTEEGKVNFREGIACMKQASINKAVFDYFKDNKEVVGMYDEEVIRIAEDIIYFFFNIIFNDVPFEGEDKLPKLTDNQYHLLLCVESGFDTLTKLENHLGSSGSTLSIGISKLVEKGYLAKAYPESGDDGRRVYIKMTEKGQEVLDKLDKLLLNNFVTYFKRLDIEKQQLFERGCDLLINSLENM